MPIYVNHCKACDHEFEVWESITIGTPTPCEKCDSEDTYRVIHAPGISFKGDGFYVNDSKKDAKNAAKKRYEGDKYTPSE